MRLFGAPAPGQNYLREETIITGFDRPLHHN
jgi:hypothetical protein